MQNRAQRITVHRHTNIRKPSSMANFTPKKIQQKLNKTKTNGLHFKIPHLDVFKNLVL
jgi:hypothetical protein